MANIISSICFSNSNNDYANNGGDFKVGVCAKLACLCGSIFPLSKAQEIDVPLASTGRLASESALHMFSPKTVAERC